MFKCKYCNYEKPVEKPFVRPKSGNSVGTVNITTAGNPLVTIATPAILYAMGNTPKVDTDILKIKEVPIDFTSSGSVPKLEAEAKASSGNLVNFVGNTGSIRIEEPSVVIPPYTEPPVMDFVTIDIPETYRNIYDDNYTVIGQEIETPAITVKFPRSSLTLDLVEPETWELDGYTVEKLKQYLDERQIEYTSSDLKATLLTKAKTFRQKEVL